MTNGANETRTAARSGSTPYPLAATFTGDDMNNARRKAIWAVVEELSGLIAPLEEIASEEQDAFESLPEGIKETERGEEMEQAGSDLEDIGNELTDCLRRLEEIAG